MWATVRVQRVRERGTKRFVQTEWERESHSAKVKCVSCRPSERGRVIAPRLNCGERVIAPR